MAIGRLTAAASISERRRRQARIAALFALVATALVHVGAARADGDVTVLQDGTPLVSKPGVGGRILLWVDRGFPLTVVGRQGDWLEVSSAQLKAVWVPAARVGVPTAPDSRTPPGTSEIARWHEEPLHTCAWWGCRFRHRHHPFPPGNPVPPLGNPTPAMGNPVPPFQQSPVPPFRQSRVPPP